MQRREFMAAGACVVGTAVLTPASLLAQSGPGIQLELDGLVLMVRPKTGGMWRALSIDGLKLQNARRIQHWPLLRIPRAQLDKSVVQPPVIPGAPKPSKPEWQWDLTGREVQILLDGKELASGVSPLVGHRKKNSDGSWTHCPSDSHEAKDSTWIADLAQCCGDGTVKETYIGGSLDGLVFSRVRIGGGDLSCRHDTPNKNYVFRVNAGYAQNFADVVRVEIPGDTGTLSLLLVDRGGKSVEIKFGAHEALARVHIANYMADGTPPGDLAAPIEHFAAYYELLKSPPNFDPIPRYVSDCNGTKTPASMGHAGGTIKQHLGDPPAYCPPGGGNEP
jgi:hypothetical protein